MQDLFASSLRSALRNALLAVAAACLVPALAATQKSSGAVQHKPSAGAKKHAGTHGGRRAAKKATKPGRKPKQAKASSAGRKQDSKPGPLADFGDADAPAEVKHVANWISYTRNNHRKAFVVIDKKQARLYLFEPTGKLRSHTPVLLGRAVGDVIPPGTAGKPISQLKESDKTTPAGRFLARPGKNAHGANVIWVDYNAAISMHRLLKVGKEMRHERMATPDVADNRISNGCVNVPPAFYDKVLYPDVVKKGAYVYVLPETKAPQQLFGSYDVTNKAVQVAQAGASKGR